MMNENQKVLSSKSEDAIIKKTVREFETGATRDIDTNKIDYEAILSPLVARRFGQFMREHALQKDGSMRPYDNWQKGIPFSSYIKSLSRHFQDLRMEHDGYQGDDPKGIEEALCAMLFNVQGYLHEWLKGRGYGARLTRELEEKK